ncbi:MAG: T9SS type A sorting domain-containing protein [Candidatus Kapabacteria bacterium]|nr:T9SS type A sorting domain-containing protein [Candidatus Kapabacteria bacterium]
MAKAKDYLLAIILIVINCSLQYAARADSLVSGEIYGKNFWTLSQSPYIITKDLTIASGAELTIEAGCEIKLNDKVNIIVNGAIYSIGSGIRPITFSANSNIQKIGFWGSIKFINNFNLDAHIFENCIFKSSGYGDQSVFTSDGKGFPNIINCTFSLNKFSAIGLKNLTFDDNITLKPLPLPYFINSNILIPENKKLIIKRGSIIKMANHVDITVNGAIEAIGTFDNLIYFTSFRDDASDEKDCDGTASSTGIPGDWGAIIINQKQNTDHSTFRYVRFLYGGGNQSSCYSMLYAASGAALVEFCKFEASMYYGISCTGSGIIDAGRGSLDSKGFNIFSGFTAKKYAFTLKYSSDISAINNCWDSQDTSIISKMIYDGSDISLTGKVHFLPLASSCIPEKPKIPILAFPPNGTIDVPVNFYMSWKPCIWANLYNLSIAEDTAFTLNVNKFNTEDTNFFAPNLKFKSKYFWKVSAINSVGTSNWSQVFSFITDDTTKPEIPRLIFPANNSQDKLCKLQFLWNSALAAISYELDISIDNKFKILSLHVSNINDTIKTITGLINNSKYYWRLRSVNRNGQSSWSEVYSFSTTLDKCRNAPPSTWNHSIQTGSNTTLLLRKNVVNDFQNYQIKSGDAIGAFYNSDSNLYCAGYGIWEDSENLAVTIWGDNALTGNIKEGFNSNEVLRYKIWDGENENEFPTEIMLEQGENRYIQDNLSIVASINDLNSQHIPLKAGIWNYISSNIIPYFPSVNKIIESKNLTFCGNRFLNSDYSSDNINNWDYRQGYSVFTEQNDELIIKGTSVDNKTSIPLESRQWLLLPYYSSSSMFCEDVFSSIKNNLLILMNTFGDLYFPQYGLNEISQISPAEGYLAFLSNPDTLNFPIKSNNSAYNLHPRPSHFPRHSFGTGNINIFIIESNKFAKGDEIAIADVKGNIYGSSVCIEGKAVVCVYGDNRKTSMNVEGPTENSLLKIIHFNKKTGKEQVLLPMSIIDLNDATNFGKTLKFNSGKIDFITINTPSDIEENTQSSHLKFYNTNLNVNHILSINYLSEGSAIADISIYDIYGNLIISKTEFSNSGLNRINIDFNDFSSGIYIIKLAVGEQCQINKVNIIK